MMRIFFLIVLPALFFPGCSQKGHNTEQYHVTWTTPSSDSFGSMPLGNGDIGANVWMEPSGDLLFYISKVDAFDAGHGLPKLGRIRVKADPAFSVAPFSQTLSLSDASVQISAGNARLRIWVDANQPVIRIEGECTTPRKITASLETLRPLAEYGKTLPTTGTAGVLFTDHNDQLAWCYVNQSSVWSDNAWQQNSPGWTEKVGDPLLHRISGCLLRGEGLVREGEYSLVSEVPTTAPVLEVKVVSSQPAGLEAWLSEAEQPVLSDWDKHAGWWDSFWQRSYIHITSGGEGKQHFDHARYTLHDQGAKAYGGLKDTDAAENVARISLKYALERFCQAAASRGEVPPPFNGSIFTMDMPAGTHQFIDQGTRRQAVNADNRDWNGLPFFWQNTRHPLWSMLARGDYDTMLPAFITVLGTLETGRDRSLNWFGHEGSFMTEGVFWRGISVFNDLPAHLKHHYLGTIEMTTMMCDYYEHTGDTAFLQEILLPCADEFIKFYELHYPLRDNNGRMVIAPAGVTETYSEVTNPVTEVSGLRSLLSKLISIGDKQIGEQRIRHWSGFLEALPGIPQRTVKGLQLLAPGEKYTGRLICETPELYPVWPFRQITPALLAGARQSYNVRQLSLDGTPDDQSWETGGWQSAPIWAAYLGLPREAARLVSINFEDNLPNFTYRNEHMEPPVPDRPRARFPAFWETKMDYTPDNDHGGVSVNALQSMLIQEEGRKIKLLPAWPEEWDVSFRLHTASNTVVECEYRNGKVRRLKVEPEHRMADIDDRSTPHNRIRNLVEVALSDRNYLFGLPPMLDAQPTGGKATSPWLQQYGHTLEGCKAGPWANSVFKDNIVFVHILQWPEDGVHLSSIPRKLVGFEPVTGDIRVAETVEGWHLEGTPDPLNTIVKLEFDRSVEEIAYGLPSAGSYTHGRDLTVEQVGEGMLAATVELDTVKLINRIEFTIDNPGYVWGNGKTFEFSIRDEDGVWRPYYTGKVYGTIFSRAVDPVAAEAIRLVVGAGSVRQLDIF